VLDADASRCGLAAYQRGGPPGWIRASPPADPVPRRTRIARARPTRWSGPSRKAPSTPAHGESWASATDRSPDDIDVEEDLRVPHRVSALPVARRPSPSRGGGQLPSSGAPGGRSPLLRDRSAVAFRLANVESSSAPNAPGETGAPDPLRERRAPNYDGDGLRTPIASEPSHNNTSTSGTSESGALQRRRWEQMQPNFLSWWRDVGPEGFQGHDVYLRTAISVEPTLGDPSTTSAAGVPVGHLPRPQERRAPPSASATIWASGRGTTFPGEHRNALRRIIVTQADTEPASVEQQRMLGKVAPSMYDSAQPLPGQRRGGPSPVGDGLPAPPGISGPRRTRGGGRVCSRGARARPTSRASSNASTSRSTTG